MSDIASRSPKFVHLHLHTHYSLLDGATRIEALVRRVKELGMPAVAVTDHGNLFGAIEFYKAARAAGVKPIIGCEVYLAPGDRRAREGGGIKEASYHLLLLASNRTGYRNLLRLASIAYTEGFYYRPRIDKEILRELSEGLICTSTCLGGEIPQALANHNRARAEEAAKTYLEIFGPDRFFIELQDHGIPDQKVLNPELAEVAGRLGVGTIATNDVHYLSADDVEAHDILCCISTGKLVAEEDRFKFPTGEFYLKTAEQMGGLFGAYPEALANTVRVAGMCELEFDFSRRHAPVYQVEKGTTPDAQLRQRVYEGAEHKYGEITAELRQRIDYELEVIASKGFSSYFLIVWDFVQYARRNNIPCGARGSGCSSVVSYCLGISAPDPLKYGLYFERFMDPDRDEMPDIDVDICQVGRAQVIDYVRSKYGHVAQIITFGTLKARAAVKDVARVMGWSFDEANQVTALIPNELKMTVDRALAEEPELRKRYEADERVRQVIDISRRLEGLARHAGVHAAGVVVADQPLDNFLPLYKPPGDEAIVTQFDGNTVEAVGLLKMDFLGLRTLTTLQRARELVKQHHGIEVDLEKLDLEDQRVYALFAAGHTKGVFQFESGGMRDVIMRMRPNRIQDLIAANALYRPGPMKYIDEYVARKHGQRWTTPHPAMTAELEETYGIMVYQEQVSRVVNKLGGLELKRAFRLAKLISKKKTEQIEKEREPFLQGCVASGVSRATAEQIFGDILEFGGYAFNKAHSTGYALVAYQTAYMKAYYPGEFMAALLTFEMDSTAKIEEYIDECRRMEIEVLPPDVNASQHDFTPDYRTPGRRVIRFGLGAIKGVGEKAVTAVLEARRQGGRFESLFDFCDRVDLSAVNRAVLEGLICCGAFDDTGAMRKALLDVLDDAIQAGQAVQEDKRSGQMSLFMGPESGGGARSGGRRLSSEEWNEAEMLAREKAVLGFYVTRHPLAACGEVLEACATSTTAGLRSQAEGARVVVGGLITGLRKVAIRDNGRAGERMGILAVEDLTGKVDVVLSPQVLEANLALLKPDSVVFVRGTVSRRREEPSVRAVEVIPLERAVRELCTCLVLRLDSAADDEQLLGELFAACRRHPGPRPVYVEIRTPEGQVAVINGGVSLSVAGDAACLADLAAVVGPERVLCVGPTRRPIPWHGSGAGAAGGASREVVATG